MFGITHGDIVRGQEVPVPVKLHDPISVAFFAFEELQDLYRQRNRATEIDDESAAVHDLLRGISIILPIQVRVCVRV